MQAVNIMCDRVQYSCVQYNYQFSLDMIHYWSDCSQAFAESHMSVCTFWHRQGHPILQYNEREQWALRFILDDVHDVPWSGAEQTSSNWNKNWNYRGSQVEKHWVFW